MRNSLVALALLLVAGTVSAQPRPASKAQPKPSPIEEQLKELSTRVDEAMRAAADSAAALKALQDLQRQINDLRRAEEGRRDMLRGYQETRRALEDLDKRLGNTELQLAAMKMEMARRGEMAGYDEGLFLQTPNRRFLIRLNGLLQADYQGKIWEGGRLPADGQLGENQSTFLLRRASLSVSGHLLLRQLAYYLELDFGSQDPGPLLEGWADIRFHRALNLRGGKLKVPVSRELLTHSSRLTFTERSGPVLAFAPGWDLGAMLHGDIPLPGGLSYQVGIFNGAGGLAEQNDNIDLLYAVRLATEPLGRMVEGEGDRQVSPFRFGLGASFAYNLAPTDLPLRKGAIDSASIARLSDKDGDGNTDNVAIYTVAVDLAARFAGASLESEFFYRREDAGKLGGDETLFGSGFGVFAQAGYCFPFLRDLQLAVRYSYWEPTWFGESRVVYRPDEIHELAAVVNLMMFGRLLKWQIEYDHQWQRGLHTATESAGQGANVNIVRLQVQAAF